MLRVFTLVIPIPIDCNQPAQRAKEKLRMQAGTEKVRGRFYSV